MNLRFLLAFLIFVSLGAHATPAFAETHLYVKFLDDTPMLATPGGALMPIGESVSNDEIRQLNDIATARWMPVHDLPRERLREMRSVGEQRSGRALPDLSTEFFLQLRGEWTTLEGEMAEILDVHPLIEYWEVAQVEVVPPPTPDFVSSQAYLLSPANGIGASAVWSMGYTGAGVTVGVIENGFYGGHHDIPAGIPNLHGMITSNTNWRQHGTASIGVIAALNNGWGTKGIAYGSTIKFFSTINSSGSYNPASSVSTATSVLSAGDVLMVNAQREPSPGVLVPIEYYAAEYNAVATAVANGIVVVIAGANGGLNLDTSAGYGYSRDSGAIYVGAGASPQHSSPRSRLSFSNYGSRVNVQAWGHHVFTTGYGVALGPEPYGTAYASEGINRYYTGSYNGTSSATPIVTGTVALLQSAHKGTFGVPATPAVMREALRTSGAAQNSAVSGNIGPQVSVQGAWYYFTTSPPSLSVTDWWCYGQGDATWSSVATANTYQLQGRTYSGGTQFFYIGSNTSAFFTVSESTTFFVRACVDYLGAGCTKWSNGAGPVHAHSMCH